MKHRILSDKRTRPRALSRRSSRRPTLEIGRVVNQGQPAEGVETRRALFSSDAPLEDTPSAGILGGEPVDPGGTAGENTSVRVQPATVCSLCEYQEHSPPPVRHGPDDDSWTDLDDLTMGVLSVELDEDQFLGLALDW